MANTFQTAKMNPSPLERTFMAYKLTLEIEELTVDRIETTLELILKEIGKGNKSGLNRFSDVAEENIKELYGVEIDSGNYQYNIIKI